MPRNVNLSLKAADRIPGLRPKTVKVRGAPPPWVDWVHKCGPVLTVLASAAIFYFTFKYTVEPVYKRALLEEANAQLETARTKLVREVDRVRGEITSTALALNQREIEVRDAKLQLVELERQRLISAGMSATSAKQASQLGAQLQDSKIALVGASENLAEKRLALAQTEQALAMRSKDVESALKQVIQNLVAANEAPCSLSAVRVYLFELHKDINFQKPCVSATLNSPKVPISLLPADRQSELKALAENIDSAHARERMDLAKEFNDLAQRATDIAARDVRQSRQTGKTTSVQRPAGEPAKDYVSPEIAIQNRLNDKLKHIDDRSSFHKKSTEYVKRVHDEFLTQSENQRIHQHNSPD